MSPPALKQKSVAAQVVNRPFLGLRYRSLTTFLHFIKVLRPRRVCDEMRNMDLADALIFAIAAAADLAVLAFLRWMRSRRRQRERVTRSLALALRYQRI